MALAFVAEKTRTPAADIKGMILGLGLDALRRELLRAGCVDLPFRFAITPADPAGPSQGPTEVVPFPGR